MQQTLIAISIILVTIGAYLVMTKLYTRFSYPIFLPVITTTITIVLLLLVFHISYKNYMVGGKWINSLLGPGVVALAYPLYNSRKILMNNIFPIFTGVFIGMLFGMVSGLLFAEAFGINRDLILSILPKSITTPVAIQITTSLGGVPSMTAVFVMIAGISGVVIGPAILKWVRIHSFLGKGIAFGSASHALGTAKTIEYGELAVSMSSVSMTLSALLGSIFGPIVVWIFHI
ncbi:LrgB family protein [Priestia filamentosa]|uniref:LrgB family protein n=1 Tax=Priestia filamentosa TaxID=1402861 RepID=UPI001FB21222|nr:LrgB family protein [Priestia filamentosa]MED3728465.1 LrgB family protein [Priestia filamentosa]UOE62583.1 LrgB family protein [Priestia filamentosa]